MHRGVLGGAPSLPTYTPKRPTHSSEMRCSVVAKWPIIKVRSRKEEMKEGAGFEPRREGATSAPSNPLGADMALGGLRGSEGGRMSPLPGRNPRGAEEARRKTPSFE